MTKINTSIEKGSLFEHQRLDFTMIFITLRNQAYKGFKASLRTNQCLIKSENLIQLFLMH